MTELPALRAENVCVRLRSGHQIVRGVDLELGRGEILGLVGESGSGKTTLARALLGYAAPGTSIASGTATIAGQSLPLDQAWRRLRGSTISYVPQDPGRSLNPALSVADSLQDVIRAHRVRATDAEMRRHFAGVGLPDTSDFQHRLPHQLSGGQQQRVCIAASLACEPPVVVLDEPTTGLDVVTQSRVVAELARLRDEHGVSMIYVTHDLAVVAQIADRVAVMYNGRLVEQGPARVLLSRPRHPYTHGLLASTPDHLAPRRLEPMDGVAPPVGEEPSGCAFAPRCSLVDDSCTARVPEVVVDGGHSVRCLHPTQVAGIRLDVVGRPARADAARPVLLEVADLAIEYRNRTTTTSVAAGVSFAVRRGACVALVGESGSGKTSIARAVSGLIAPTAGRVYLEGEPLPALARSRSVAQRRRVQLVFQNPADALNPRRTVADQVGRPATLLRGLRRGALEAEVDRQLESVRLPTRVRHRYPGELSGGERQRVAIARALAADPGVLVCDEITSALDVSVQAAVLDLLMTLRDERDLGLLFITHDLGVVASVADEVLVLEGGSVCEQGTVDAVLRAPRTAYTRRLLAAAPSVSALVGGAHLDSDEAEPVGAS